MPETSAGGVLSARMTVLEVVPQGRNQCALFGNMVASSQKPRKKVVWLGWDAVVAYSVIGFDLLQSMMCARVSCGGSVGLLFHTFGSEHRLEKI